MCLGFVVTIVSFSVAQGSNSTAIISFLGQELVCLWFYLNICVPSYVGLPLVLYLKEKESLYKFLAFVQQKIAVSCYLMLVSLVVEHREGVSMPILIQSKSQKGTNSLVPKRGSFLVVLSHLQLQETSIGLGLESIPTLPTRQRVLFCSFLLPAIFFHQLPKCYRFSFFVACLFVC